MPTWITRASSDPVSTPRAKSFSSPASTWARLACALGFVIGIEAIVECLVERLIAVEMAGENEGLEEPSRMRKMPFGWTGVVHPLDGHILAAERAGEV